MSQNDTTKDETLNRKRVEGFSMLNSLRRLLQLFKGDNMSAQGTFASPQPGWIDFEVARTFRDGVVQIRETGDGRLSGLLLERAAATFLVRSHMARAGHALAASAFSDSDWKQARLVPIIQEALSNLSEAQESSVVESLCQADEYSMCRLTLQQQMTLTAGLRSFVEDLLEPLEIEAHRVNPAWVSKSKRWGIPAIVLLLVVGAIAPWAARLFAKPNIALHRPVEVSSQYPGADTDHSRLVDGNSGTLGFHTLCDGQQFVIIDLGAVRRIHKVVVYNRPGAEERAAPLRLDVSTDHLLFTQVASRLDVFDKWVADGLDTYGRYVRLRNPPNNCFHLNEVEVY